jgi:hypothetical protein
MATQKAKTNARSLTRKINHVLREIHSLGCVETPRRKVLQQDYARLSAEYRKAMGF